MNVLLTMNLCYIVLFLEPLHWLLFHYFVNLFADVSTVLRKNVIDSLSPKKMLITNVHLILPYIQKILAKIEI